jgi:hypothetical protein
MRLIIDIFEEDYESAKQRWARGDSVHKMDYCVSKGISLDDVKTKIEKATTLTIGMTGYVETKKIIEILDNIGKAESEEN